MNKPVLPVEMMARLNSISNTYCLEQQLGGKFIPVTTREQPKVPVVEDSSPQKRILTYYLEDQGIETD